MLYCFLLSPHCELFNYTISPDNADALSKCDTTSVSFSVPFGGERLHTINCE